MAVDCGSARDCLGHTLDGKYRLEAILGAGGTAVVYLAVGPGGQRVAVKVMHAHLSRLDDVCQRFAREGELGDLLDHPSTVRVLDRGVTDEGAPYLTLEYLEGESLEERRVRVGGRLDVAETLELCDQLLAVLEVAHAKNVIHRDIKPSNLFVTASGLLKVLDFGIARLTDEASSTATKTGQSLGTPAFMSPEQALSRPGDVDPRTDIFSVGATVFTLLSGEHVHLAESSSEHLVKAATLPARSLAHALPGVPANVEALVARCLAFDKHDRWPSAQAMRDGLSLVREDPGRRIGTSTSPPPPDPNSERLTDTGMAISGRPRSLRPPRRWLLPIAIASTLGLVMMSAVVVVLAVRSTRLSLASGRASAPPPVASTSPQPLADGSAATAPQLVRPPKPSAAPPSKKPPPLRKDAGKPP